MAGGSNIYVPGHFAVILSAPAWMNFSVDRGIPPQAGPRCCDQQSLHALHEPGEKLKECWVVAVIDALDIPES